MDILLDNPHYQSHQAQLAPNRLLKPESIGCLQTMQQVSRVKHIEKIGLDTVNDRITNLDSSVAQLLAQLHQTHQPIPGCVPRGDMRISFPSSGS